MEGSLFPGSMLLNVCHHWIWLPRISTGMNGGLGIFTGVRAS
ncbi:hypothetical protein LINPERPRIM_LOCUS40663 [Linum perenne]